MIRPGTHRVPLVGILGGGQLARMMALAGLPLGFRFRFLDPSPDSPARDLGAVVGVGASFDDPEAIRAFVEDVDLVTYEFENVPNATARAIEEHAPVLPPVRALEVASDRLEEKRTFERLGIATAAYRAVNDRTELDRAVEEIGLPAILKTRRLGYDGKGQWVLNDSGDIEAAWAEAAGGPPMILEERVPFRRELSVLGVRDRVGRTVFYPLSENEHRDGILVVTRAPATPLSPDVERAATDAVGRLLEELRYVGVLALELFDTGESILANEIAPRVHNSGHWTQDGAATSQFENHLRAVAGFPLGSPDARGWTGMVNLLGSVPGSAELLSVPGARLHLYDKAPRPGRKLGHVNVVAGSPEERDERLAAVEAVVKNAEERARPRQAAQASQRP